MSDRVSLADALLDTDYPVGRGRWIKRRALLDGEPEALAAVAAEAKNQAGTLRKKAAAMLERAAVLDRAAALKGRAPRALTGEDRDTLKQAAEVLMPGLKKMTAT